MNIFSPDKVLESFNSLKPIVIRDDSEVDGTGVLSFPAQETADGILNTALHLSLGGTVQVAISPTRAKIFELQPMSQNRTSQKRQDTRELISVEAREGVSTGISIADRARTLSVIGASEPKIQDIVKPGHIFPVVTREGGVLVRSSLPETGVDIAKLTGHTDAACILTLLNEDGEYRRGTELSTWAKTHKLLVVNISDVISYRLNNENLVYRTTEAKLPTKSAGEMRSYLYRSDVYAGDHIALVKGEISPNKPTPVRVQPENTFADVFQTENSSIINSALSAIGERDCGVFVYLRRPDSRPVHRELSDREISLCEKARSPEKKRTNRTKMKEYGIGAQILKDLGVKNITLLSGGTTSIPGLEAYGLKIVETHAIKDSS